jgi:hypothetical protein
MGPWPSLHHCPLYTVAWRVRWWWCSISAANWDCRWRVSDLYLSTPILVIFGCLVGNKMVDRRILVGSQYTMDVASLQKMLADDVSAGRAPLVVIADSGTPITGHVDNIARIKELCRLHDAWLHLRGHSLAALALPNYQRNGHVSCFCRQRRLYASC